MSLIPAALGECPSGQAPGVPYSPLYDDIYHAAAGAWAQARDVFLDGNQLPQRWQQRPRFVILEAGFGLGNNFLATWAAWRDDPQRCDRLVFISVEKHPLRLEDLTQVHLQAQTTSTAAAQHAPLAQRLLTQWPPLTAGWHTLHFDEPLDASGRLQGVTLQLGLGDIADLLPGLLAQVDAFYLDGFAPAKNPDMWDEGLLSRLNRLAAPDATVATWSVARSVRDGLTQAGFIVERAPGFAGKRDKIRARYAPRYTPEPQAGGLGPTVPPEHRHAIVLGAGLAGCSAAWALCRQGWRVTLLDQHEGPAEEGSGNPGGLFHSVLHGDDGIHARAHRAAALATWRQTRAWMAEGRLAGQYTGLIRLDGKTRDDDARALLTRLNLPEDHVQWLDADAARTLAGLALPSGGWLFHQAGWLHPAGYARCLLEEAASWQREGTPLLTCFWGRTAARLTRDEAGMWQVRDTAGACVATAPSLVLACAHQTPVLLAGLPPEEAVDLPPMSKVRGQITALDRSNPAVADAHLPALPVAGSGYVLPLTGERLLCGATTQHHDDDATVRDTDHRHNLQQAARLGALPYGVAEAALPPGLRGRTGWRATTPDRLPLVGAPAWSGERLQQAGHRLRLDQVRRIPRSRSALGGLYLLTGLGSRGITWTALAGELLAHWVTGSPCPVEADLRDALDPARFLARFTRQGGAAPSPAGA